VLHDSIKYQDGKLSNVRSALFPLSTLSKVITSAHPPLFRSLAQLISFPLPIECFPVVFPVQKFINDKQEFESLSQY